MNDRAQVLPNEHIIHSGSSTCAVLFRARFPFFLTSIRLLQPIDKRHD
jgi:hypothetical protein